LVRAFEQEGKLATTLADTRVLFNGIPAPLLYVSHTQSSAIVPYAMAGQSSVDVQVEFAGERSPAVSVPVLASRPGIFSLDGSGRGQAAILNEDGSLNSRSNPARRGSVISIFGTGGGEAVTGLGDGQLVPDIQLRVSLPVSASFLEAQGLAEGKVLYAGGVPGAVAGLLQLDVRLPANGTFSEAVCIVLVVGPYWTACQVNVAMR
jgi:uncharacterized protein (TIGR03437 family)